MAGPADVDRFRPPVTAPLHILLALRGGERHGHAIMTGVDALRAGRPAARPTGRARPRLPR